MKKFFVFLTFVFALTLIPSKSFSAPGVNMDHGYNAVIWLGNFAKALRPNLNLNDQAYILAGSTDPSSVATLAPAGSLYLRANGSAYVKADSGSSTNWSLVGAAGSYLTALTGDVTASGPGSAAATVALVGGSSAANVHSAELAANAATASPTASTIVKRDAGGSAQFAQLGAGVVTLGNFAGGGSIGSAASTVDIGQAINVAQTTAGQSLTLPSPTDSTHAHVVYVVNTGSQSFTLLTKTVAASGAQAAVWNGSAWTPF
jgi:trimeric autotransporter adhesin